LDVVPEAPPDSIFITHQLEVLRIPLELLEVDFDYNYIGNVAIVGYVLCALIILGSIGFMVWTWFFRTDQVVKASQPVFLSMICLGTLLMGSSIVSLSIDDQIVSGPRTLPVWPRPGSSNSGSQSPFPLYSARRGG